MLAIEFLLTTGVTNLHKIATRAIVQSTEVQILQTSEYVLPLTKHLAENKMYSQLRYRLCTVELQGESIVQSWSNKRTQIAGPEFESKLCTTKNRHNNAFLFLAVFTLQVNPPTSQCVPPLLLQWVLDI